MEHYEKIRLTGIETSTCYRFTICFYIELAVIRKGKELGLYLEDLWGHDAWVEGSLEVITQHLGLAPPSPYDAHMTYVRSWNERFLRYDNVGPLGTHHSSLRG